MTWSFQPATATFEALQQDWNALNRARGNHILLDSRFVSPLLRHFGEQNCLLGIDRNSPIAGMALVVKKATGLWETFQPSQAPLGMILVGRRDETGEELLGLTRQLPGYPFQFSVLQQDPDYSSFPSNLNRTDIATMDYIQTARLFVSGTFEDYWKSRGTNLRHNLARRRRRMAEKGHTMELVGHRTPSAVAACIREYGRLESRGWKGSEGTAVSADNAQGAFYQQIFEDFCASGEGVIYQLLIDGKVAASDLCLQRDGMLVVLKTAYDEECEEFSPALLMRQEIMQRMFAEGQIRVVEFYGKVREWHTKWTDQIRTMYHITCFRHSWVPRMKQWVKHFR